MIIHEYSDFIFLVCNSWLTIMQLAFFIKIQVHPLQVYVKIVFLSFMNFNIVLHNNSILKLLITIIFFVYSLVYQQQKNNKNCLIMCYKSYNYYYPSINRFLDISIVLSIKSIQLFIKYQLISRCTVHIIYILSYK